MNGILPKIEEGASKKPRPGHLPGRTNTPFPPQREALTTIAPLPQRPQYLPHVPTSAKATSARASSARNQAIVKRSRESTVLPTIPDASPKPAPNQWEMIPEELEPACIIDIEESLGDNAEETASRQPEVETLYKIEEEISKDSTNETSRKLRQPVDMLAAPDFDLNDYLEYLDSRTAFEAEATVPSAEPPTAADELLAQHQRLPSIEEATRRTSIKSISEQKRSKNNLLPTSRHSSKELIMPHLPGRHSSKELVAPRMPSNKSLLMKYPRENKSHTASSEMLPVLQSRSTGSSTRSKASPAREDVVMPSLLGAGTARKGSKRNALSKRSDDEAFHEDLSSEQRKPTKSSHKRSKHSKTRMPSIGDVDDEIACQAAADKCDVVVTRPHVNNIYSRHSTSSGGGNVSASYEDTSPSSLVAPRTKPSKSRQMTHAAAYCSGRQANKGIASSNPNANLHSSGLSMRHSGKLSYAALNGGRPALANIGSGGNRSDPRSELLAEKLCQEALAMDIDLDLSYLHPESQPPSNADNPSMPDEDIRLESVSPAAESPSVLQDNWTAITTKNLVSRDEVIGSLKSGAHASGKTNSRKQRIKTSIRRRRQVMSPALGKPDAINQRHK